MFGILHEILLNTVVVDTVGIPSLKKEGKQLSDNQIKANILNEQFRSKPIFVFYIKMPK